jgi:hypothetical protein
VTTVDMSPTTINHEAHEDTKITKTNNVFFVFFVTFVFILHRRRRVTRE